MRTKKLAGPEDASLIKRNLAVAGIVRKNMHLREDRSKGLRSTLVWIYVGAGTFLLALLASAVLVPDLRVLHALQALIYVAVIVFASRNSAWVYGGASSIAIFWNAMSLFITHLMQTGAHDFLLLAQTGHARELVPMTVTLGGIGHFVLLCSSVLAATHLDRETYKWWKFVGGGALSMAYFALLIAFFQPH